MKMEEERGKNSVKVNHTKIRKKKQLKSEEMTKWFLNYLKKNSQKLKNGHYPKIHHLRVGGRFLKKRLRHRRWRNRIREGGGRKGKGKLERGKGGGGGWIAKM